MSRIVHLALDIYHDPRREKVVEAFQKHASVPVEVKGTKFMSPEELEHLSDQDFALVYVDRANRRHRLMPIVDPAHLWLAAQYLETQGDWLPRKAQVIAAQNIVRRATFMDMPGGLPSSIQEIADSRTPQEATTVTYSEPNEERDAKNDEILPPHLDRDDNLFLETEEDAKSLAKSINERRKPEKMRLKDWSKDQELPGGPPPIKLPKAQEKKANLEDYAFVDRAGQPHYPIGSPELVKKAVSWFAKHYSALPLPTRRGIAEKIADKARAFQIADRLPSLHLTVMGKYAGTNYNPDFEEHLASRSRATSDPEIVQVLQVMRDRYADIPAQKTAEALNKLDNYAGFDSYYGTHFPDAFASTLTWHAKVATVGEDTDITEDEMKRLLARPDMWRKYLDESTMNHLAASPMTVYPTLPKPHKAVVNELVGHLRDMQTPDEA